ASWKTAAGISSVGHMDRLPFLDESPARIVAGWRRRPQSGERVGRRGGAPAPPPAKYRLTRRPVSGTPVSRSRGERQRAGLSRPARAPFNTNERSCPMRIAGVSRRPIARRHAGLAAAALLALAGPAAAQSVQP